MTNHWTDLQNSDVVMINGSNAAENHPISMKWVQAARDKGAKLMVIDPRFSRSAALADLYVPIRSGSDMAFYGGLYNYIFEKELWHDDYVKSYTNASYLVKDTYTFEDGLFSGYNAEKKSYDATQWNYEIAEEVPWDTSPTGAFSWVTKPGTPAFAPLVNKKAKKDATLQDPKCVFQLMKTHYSRYDADTVSGITGIDKDLLLQAYEMYAATGQPGKAGVIMYAMGQTQHSYGSQNCRAMSVLQLLLGNIGIAGGGVDALRGESNVQGSTDMGLLFGNLPGYLNVPTVARPTLASYIEKETQYAGFWSNRPKFFISMLKEWYGPYATLENNYAYDMIPKNDGTPHSHIHMFEAMEAGKIEGLMLWGQNPAVGGPNCSQERRAMAKLKWMVAVDLWETETSIFWSDRAPATNPAEIDTEVFLLPAACHFEKQGEVANSGRWIQWRYKAVEPPGECKDDAEIISELYLKLKELYEAEGGANPEQLTKLHWPYLNEEGHIDVTKIALGINGYVIDPATGGPKGGVGLASFANLQADGTTASGVWIYTGYFTGNYIDPDDPEKKKTIASMDPTKMKTGSRNNADEPTVEGTKPLGLYMGWAWAWPLNRRIIYNRCSCDAAGNPYNADKVLVKWDGTKWLRNDVPDFGFQVVAADGTVTPTAPEKTLSFMMTNETVAKLFASVMKEGPFPEHYEPFESPLTNALSGQQTNPAVTVVESAAKTLGKPEDYPIVMTTFRLTEHWQTGGLTRNLPWLVETMPKMFVEISKELAEEKGIVSGDNVVIENNRGAITAYAMVTGRIQPLTAGGKTIHQIAAPWHWGYGGTCSIGGMANDLTPNVGDANTHIPEYKTFLVDIRKQEV